MIDVLTTDSFSPHLSNLICLYLSIHQPTNIIDDEEEEDQIRQLEKLNPEQQAEQLNKLKLQSFLVENTDAEYYNKINNNNNSYMMGSSLNNAAAYPELNAWKGFGSTSTSNDSAFNFKF